MLLRILTPILSLYPLYVAELLHISKFLSPADFKPAVPSPNDVTKAKNFTAGIPSYINPNVLNFKNVEKMKHPSSDVKIKK